MGTESPPAMVERREVLRGKPIARNITSLVLGQVITKAVNMAASIAVVRWLGVESLGQYAYIVAFCFPFGAVADFGLATLATREISRDRTRAGAVIRTMRRLVLRLSGISLSVMVATGLVLHHDWPTIVGITLFGVSSVLSAMTTPWLVLMTAREDLHLVSVHRVTASLASSLATVGVLLAGGRVLSLLAIGVSVSVVMLGVARALAGSAQPSVSTVPVTMRSMLAQALPVGLLMAAFALYYRVDMIILEALRGPTEVGLYAAAYRFVDAFVLLAASISGPFFPKLSSLGDRNRPAARGLLEDAWRPLFALGLPLSVGGFILADGLVVLAFGRDFAASAAPLRILVWMVLPLFWVSVANQGLIAADRVWSLATVYTATLVVNVVGNLILVPSFGATGAALAMVIAEWANLALVIVLLRRTFGVTFAAAGMWRAAAAATAMALSVVASHAYGPITALTVGAISYPTALLMLGYAQSADMAALRRLLAQ